MVQSNDLREHVDPFNLQRFISAQAGIYERVLQELNSGQKKSHWMWFIFPQIDGLGSSTITIHFAIKSLAEAQLYLRHPVLGERLVKCTQAVMAIEGRPISEIFGYPDDLKLKSCMTLFEIVNGSGSIFTQVLEKYFDGRRDELTLQRLKEINR